MTLNGTAPVYDFGRSEEIVGKALEGSLRHKVTIATKIGLAWKHGAVYCDYRPARIRKEIEDSLRRLRTDVIDLYQVHWPDFETPIAETARTLDDLRREGKIPAIGVSNYSPAQMEAFCAVAGSRAKSAKTVSSSSTASCGSQPGGWACVAFRQGASTLLAARPNKCPRITRHIVVSNHVISWA